MKLSISPQISLADEDTLFVLSKLEPETIYECVFSTRDKHGNEWSSSYHFPTNGSGEIHLAQHLDHPLGFIRDMKSDQPFKFDQNGAEPFEITVTLSQNGKTIGSNVIRRVYADGVEKVDIRKNGIYGYGYYPKTQAIDTAVVLFSGSGGGLGEGRASLYASRGITCFSIPYFRHEGLPQTLENIPLEYFPKAINHLKENYNIEKFVAIGTSRGGELVLLLASLFPKLFQGIIAIVPSSAIYGGMPDLTKPAWLYQEQPLPIAPFPTGEDLLNVVDISKPVGMTPFILQTMKDKIDAFTTAGIEVERITCPIQLISAMDDQMWPSTEYCNQILTRLKAHNKDHLCTHLAYKGAGHIIAHPYVPSTNNNAHHPLQGIVFDNGGNTVDHFLAVEDAWKHNLSFIRSL